MEQIFKSRPDALCKCSGGKFKISMSQKNLFNKIFVKCNKIYFLNF